MIDFKTIVPQIPTACCADISADGKYLGVGTTAGDVLIFREDDRHTFKLDALIDHSSVRCTEDSIGWMFWMKNNHLFVASKGDPFICIYSLENNTQEDVLDDLVLDESVNSQPMTSIFKLECLRYVDETSESLNTKKRSNREEKSTVHEQQKRRQELTNNVKWSREILELPEYEPWETLENCDVNSNRDIILVLGKDPSFRYFIVQNQEETWVSMNVESKIPQFTWFFWSRENPSEFFVMDKELKIYKLTTDLGIIPVCDIVGVSSILNVPNFLTFNGPITFTHRKGMTVLFDTDGVNSVSELVEGIWLNVKIEWSGPKHKFGFIVASDVLLLLGGDETPAVLGPVETPEQKSWECVLFLGPPPSWADDSTPKTNRIHSQKIIFARLLNADAVMLTICEGGKILKWGVSDLRIIEDN